MFTLETRKGGIIFKSLDSSLDSSSRKHCVYILNSKEEHFIIFYTLEDLFMFYRMYPKATSHESPDYQIRILCCNM